MNHKVAQLTSITPNPNPPAHIFNNADVPSTFPQDPQVQLLRVSASARRALEAKRLERARGQLKEAIRKSQERPKTRSSKAPH